MKLGSISAYAGGSFAFWGGDGDLFWRHIIEVNGNPRGWPAGRAFSGDSPCPYIACERREAPFESLFENLEHAHETLGLSNCGVGLKLK